MATNETEWGVKKLIETIQRSQQESHNLYMDAFKSLSSKIDDLREIEPTITRVVERLDNHIGQASRVHKEHNDAIESLKQEKWIRHGFSGAIGLISGAISTIFFHSK